MTNKIGAIRTGPMQDNRDLDILAASRSDNNSGSTRADGQRSPAKARSGTLSAALNREPANPLQAMKYAPSSQGTLSQEKSLHLALDSSVIRENHLPAEMLSLVDHTDTISATGATGRAGESSPGTTEPNTLITRPPCSAYDVQTVRQDGARFTQALEAGYNGQDVISPVSGAAYNEVLCADSTGGDLAIYNAEVEQQMLSDPTTERAMVERQLMSMDAAGKVLQSKKALFDGEPVDVPMEETFFEEYEDEVTTPCVKRAESLLAGQRELLAAASTTSTLSKSLAENSSEASPSPLKRAHDKAIARMEMRQMEQYLGAKKASKSELRKATATFRHQTAEYLRWGQSSAEGIPILAGRDETVTGVLSPSTKAAILVSTALELDHVEMEGSAAKEAASLPVVSREIGAEFRAALRSSHSTIHKDISVVDENLSGTAPGSAPGVHRFSSDLTPAAAQGREFQTVLSGDAHKADHIPNLWTTEYKDQTTSDTLFRGCRHGTLSAHGITPRHLRTLPRAELHQLIKQTLPDEASDDKIENTARAMTSRFSLKGFSLRNRARTQASLNRARELIRFNIQNNPQLMRKIQEGATSVELDLPSISLVTPDRGRRILGALGFMPQFDELAMTREHAGALETLSKQPQSITVTDGSGGKDITVHLKPIVMSFGVNIMALGPTSTLSRSWSVADVYNRGGIRTLLGDDGEKSGLVDETSGMVGRYLSDPTHSDTDKAQVRQLASQVGKLWHDKAHHRENHDPYALPARLALLTGKLGMVPNFNCKSGKDRTGQLDAEIKFLATRARMNDGHFPVPGVPLTESERVLYRTMVLGTGNHEIQKMNTGSAGYKVKLRSLTQRMGGILGYLQQLGQGNFVNA